MNDYIVVIAGSAIDEFYDVPVWVDMGDAVVAHKTAELVGGCMLNVGIVARSLGMDVKTMDWLNPRESGTELILNSMREHNMSTDWVRQSDDVKNGRCMIMCCKGDKVIFVLEADHPQYDMTDGKVQELLNGAGVIYSLVKDFGRAFGTDMEPIKIAKQHGAKVVIDGGCHYNDDVTVQGTMLADALILNTQAYDRLKARVGEDAKEQLFAHGCTYLCETKGSKGVTIYRNDGEVTDCPSLPIESVVDSTGAGDTFIASFIYGWSKGYDTETIAKFATAAGARACTNMGGLGGCGTPEEICDFAKKYGVDIKL